MSPPKKTLPKNTHTQTTAN